MTAGLRRFEEVAVRHGADRISVAQLVRILREAYLLPPTTRGSGGRVAMAAPVFAATFAAAAIGPSRLVAAVPSTLRAWGLPPVEQRSTMALSPRGGLVHQLSWVDPVPAGPAEPGLPRRRTFGESLLHGIEEAVLRGPRIIEEDVTSVLIWAGGRRAEIERSCGVRMIFQAPPSDEAEQGPKAQGAGLEVIGRGTGRFLADLGQLVLDAREEWRRSGVAPSQEDLDQLVRVLGHLPETRLPEPRAANSRGRKKKAPTHPQNGPAPGVDRPSAVPGDQIGDPAEPDPTREGGRETRGAAQGGPSPKHSEEDPGYVCRPARLHLVHA